MVNVLKHVSSTRLSSSPTAVSAIAVVAVAMVLAVLLSSEAVALC